MKLNTDKCNFIASGTKYGHVCGKLRKDKIWENNNVKLLGVKKDNELTFDEHISNICLKANRKLRALARLSRFLSLEKRRTLFKAVIESQFNYCPLIDVSRKTGKE